MQSILQMNLQTQRCVFEESEGAKMGGGGGGGGWFVWIWYEYQHL